MGFPFALLDWNVQRREILVRFLFPRHLKKSSGLHERTNLLDKEIYLDTRGMGVSINRVRYASMHKCLELASENPNQLIGFAFFRKSDFLEQVNLNKTDRVDFVASVDASPLDEDSNYIEPRLSDVFINQPGNVAHADIEYINPGVDIPTNENPNQAIRIFSRMLSKDSKMVFLADTPDLENLDPESLF